LFLDVQKGNKEIIELHKRLYTGILEKYFPAWMKNGAFLPHMTVGNFDNEEKFQLAIENMKNVFEIFTTTVLKISVEIIDENEDSIIEMEIELKNKI
jgi:hypothetical protein